MQIAHESPAGGNPPVIRICSYCEESTLDPGASFCAYCGAELPRSSDPSEQWSELPYTPPRAERGTAVAYALAALALGVIAAVALAFSSVSPGRRGSARLQAPAAVKRQPTISTAAARSPPPAMAEYRAGSYSLSYPPDWSVRAHDQLVGDYFETVLQSPDGAAKVAIDRVPGERIDPVAKAAQVESATSRSPGYQRLSFKPVTVGGRPGFEWIFKLAGGSGAQRADLFVNTGGDGFAILAYGADFARASAAARVIAASLKVTASRA
jgi:hypothetical protein